jgi:prepilin-type processing-associated H-X9-DG protein
VATRKSSGGTGIDYTGTPPNDLMPPPLLKPYVAPSAGQPIPNRQTMSDSAATALSTTRALWMVVRAGDIQVKQMVCPSSSDSPDPSKQIDVYYDFEAYNNVSYGYQVPYGPNDTRPSEALDMRMGLMADKGPYYGNTVVPGSSGTPQLDESSSPNQWKAFNSPNHGGRNAGEGQNVLYQDGHAAFEYKPIVGVDMDNIYTNMMNCAANTGRWWGRAPAPGATGSFYPGQDTFGTSTPIRWASTDTLIYP